MNNYTVFTPPAIVEKMLDLIGYNYENIKTKTIFEPAFGDGAFLKAIVNRILSYAQIYQLNSNEIYSIFDNISGVEINKELYNSTIKMLNRMIQPYGLKYDWPQLILGNTMLQPITKKFDFCIANPPYQRIHHIDLDTRVLIEKKYQFGTGNTDLYIIFFELGLSLLSEKGKMCFITPDSYLKNSSQKTFRKHLVSNNLVDTIIDYSHVNIFENISTYPVITLLNKEKKEKNTKYVYMQEINKIEFENSIDLSIFNQEPWIFTQKDDEYFLKSIREKKYKLSDFCDIQYGLATNADSIYVLPTNLMHNIESGILRPIIKGSTLYDEDKIIFPYEWNEKMKKYIIIPEDILKKKYPNAYQYLLEHQNQLTKRNMEKTKTVWYQYARSQGIQKSKSKKIVLKHVIAGQETVCKIKEMSEDYLVYSGIFIIVNENTKYEKISNILCSKDFCRYLKLVGKNMANGYKSINTTAIKEYRFN